MQEKKVTQFSPFETAVLRIGAKIRVITTEVPSTFTQQGTMSNRTLPQVTVISKVNTETFGFINHSMNFAISKIYLKCI